MSSVLSRVFCCCGRDADLAPVEPFHALPEAAAASGRVRTAAAASRVLMPHERAEQILDDAKRRAREFLLKQDPRLATDELALVRHLHFTQDEIAWTGEQVGLMDTSYEVNQLWTFMNNLEATRSSAAWQEGYASK